MYEVAVKLRDLNVLVGANGAGKSNLIRVLEMAGRIIDGELGLFTGIAGGASALRSVDFPASAPTAQAARWRPQVLPADHCNGRAGRAILPGFRA
jgi:predicted ATPase